MSQVAEIGTRSGQVDTLVPFRHQAQLMTIPFSRPDINQLFLIGGYFSAKTTALKLLVLKIADRYWQHHVIGAIMAPTITFLEKTLMGDLIAILNQTGSQFHYDAGKHRLRIGKLELRLLASGQPSEIYGHNLSFCLSDEHDELEQTKAIAANTAIQERVRIPFPDGRAPFSVIATTAQGLKGVYRIVESVKEQHLENPAVKYALIRGRTEDNKTLTPTYLDRLKGIYTADEQDAYLHGKFVNLTAGRVYYAYDEAQHFQDLAPVENHEVVYVGQDLNEGFSKATAVCIRNGRIEIVAEFSFKAIGHAPRILRESFPHNHVIWYPDNSGKPILGGYIDEIEHYGIETVYTGRNPSVLDRIFLVNKLLGMGRMVVSRKCKETSMALKTRQFDEKGVPEKGKGSKAPDHLNDSLDYVTFRIMVDHEEFADIYELSPSAHRSDRE